MDRVNRRRRLAALPTLPSLTVDISRGPASVRPVRATVDRLTADTVVVTCETGIDALSVAACARLELTFRGPGVEVSVPARPGRRVDDVHGHRCVELVLEHGDREVKLRS